MTLLKFGETVFNFDQIAFIIPEPGVNTPGMNFSAPVPAVYNIHFVGGSKVSVKHPRFMAAFEEWTTAHGFSIETLSPTDP